MKNAIACLFLLNISLCYGQFVTNTCVGDVEIAFSTEQKNFTEARKSCQSFGGDLVKIGSAEIQNAIENMGIGLQVRFLYIGAYATERNRLFYWVVDNTLLPENPRNPANGAPTSGYQNWFRHHPNAALKQCASVRTKPKFNWVCTDCNGNFQHICQRDLINVIVDSNSSTCQSTIPSVAVRWEKNSAIVESSNKGGVYQTIGTHNATLNYENANITEAGSYTCKTTNLTCFATKNYTITIDGTPTIQSVDGNKCNTSLFVTWKPNKAAVGSIHRFSVSGVDTTVDKIPNSDDYLTTEIPELESLTNYTVKIQVCEAEDSCTNSFTASINGTTNGVPVTNAILQYSNGVCSFAWTGSDQSDTYTIETLCEIDKSRTGGDGKLSTGNTSESWKSKKYQFQPGPNRRCSAHIWTDECSKIIPPVSAEFCTTPPKEPEKIEIPSIDVNGTSKIIKLPRPNEDSGLISCIFIVLCYEDCSATQFTVHDLKMASQVDASNNTDYANTIALAISMSSVAGDLVFRKLFQGEKTSCDLLNVGDVAGSRKDVIWGNNIIDNSTKNVWAYAVTSTPIGRNVLLKTSSPTFVFKERSIWLTIIGIVAGLLLIIIVAVTVVVIVRRKNAGGVSSYNTQAGNRFNMTQEEYCHDNEEVYEEIEESQPNNIRNRLGMMQRYDSYDDSQLDVHKQAISTSGQSNRNTTSQSQAGNRLATAQVQNHTTPSYSYTLYQSPDYEEVQG